MFGLEPICRVENNRVRVKILPFSLKHHSFNTLSDSTSVFYILYANTQNSYQSHKRVRRRQSAGDK